MKKQPRKCVANRKKLAKALKAHGITSNNDAVYTFKVFAMPRTVGISYFIQFGTEFVELPNSSRSDLEPISTYITARELTCILLRNATYQRKQN